MPSMFSSRSQQKTDNKTDNTLPEKSSYFNVFTLVCYTLRLWKIFQCQ